MTLTYEQIEAIREEFHCQPHEDDDMNILCDMAQRYRYLRNNLNADGPQISEWNPIVQAMDRVPLHHADQAIDRAIATITKQRGYLGTDATGAVDDADREPHESHGTRKP